MPLTHPTVTSADTRLALLRFYSVQGMRLLPVYEVSPDGRCSCGEPDCREANWGKHPRIGSWQHAATTDLATLERWHAAWPLCNWAWALDADTYVLDCDPRNGGPQTETWLADVRAAGLPEPPATLCALSGSGGLHAVYRVADGEVSKNGALVREDGSEVPGINVKGAGGYVLVSPSNHVSGGVYSWHEPWATPVEYPALAGFLTRRARRTGEASSGGNGSLVDPAPGEAFLDKWYREAPTVANGNQRGWLLSGLGWMRKRGRSEVEMVSLGVAVSERFVVYDPSEPWTAYHVAELVRDVAERYEVTQDGDGVIPAWRPYVVTGGADPGANGAAAVVDLQAAREQRADQPPVEVRNRATDVANAEELAALYGSELMWVPGLGWHTWVVEGGSGHWQPDELGRARWAAARLGDTLRLRQAEVEEDERDALRRRWGRLESVGGIEACLSLAQTPLGVRSDEVDERPWLLNCANGTLDLRTGELRPASPADRLTRVCPTAYREGASSPLLDEYRRTFVPDPARWEVLTRVLGAALVGGNPWRNLVLLVGPTTTGKSQLAAALEACLGTYAGIGGASIFRGNLDDRPRPDLLRLLSCRVALLEEAGHAWELHADRVKAVTGGGTLSVRGMRSNTFVERVPDFTPVVIANEVPGIRGSDSAIRQRLVVVKFDQRPDTEDVSKREAFLADTGVREALLSELVAGCRRAQVAGASVADLGPEATLSAMEVFEQLDNASEFLHWGLEEGVLVKDVDCPVSHCARVRELHKVYTRWCRDHGDHAAWRERLGERQFSARLRQAGWTTQPVDGVRWVGLRVVDPEVTWRP